MAMSKTCTPATPGEPAPDISMGAPAGYASDATASTVARGFLEPDPLAEELCEGAGPPIWLVSVDPMLDELAASLVVSRPAVTPAPGCLHAAASVVGGHRFSGDGYSVRDGPAITCNSVSISIH